MITEEELMAQLREQGIERVDEVKKSYMEGDGHISVLRKEAKGTSGGGEKKGMP